MKLLAPQRPLASPIASPDNRRALRCALALTILAGGSVQAQAIVKRSQKLSNLEGGMGAVLDPGDVFGNGYVVGDVDLDGRPEIAIGAGGSNDGATGAGALWLLDLGPDGVLGQPSKISLTSGQFGGPLSPGDAFGSSAASVGDLDGDGIEDIAVGARGDTEGADPGTWRGAVWILTLAADRTVKTSSKINESHGGLAAVFQDYEYFGTSLANLGDLDGDGVCELVVGARSNVPGQAGDLGGGSVWVLFLAADGTVRSHVEIADGKGGFQGSLDNGDQFGNSVSNIGDFDGDGVVDIAVGTKRDDDGGRNQGDDLGAVYILLLNADGTVKSHHKISQTEGGFNGTVSTQGFFGTTVSSPGDLDGDGVIDLVVGAKGDDDGAESAGSVFVLFLNADGTVKSHQKISATRGGFSGVLDPGDFFGSGLASVGDLDSDGVQDILVGARTDDDGGVDAGAAYVLLLDETAWAPPLASFEVEGTAGAVPLSASFTDSSSGRVSGWEWDFGDGTFSSTRNPVHTYVAEGEYTVSLTVEGPFGSDTTTVVGAVFASDDVAAATSRNNANPEVYSALSLPVFGTEWQSAVDVAGLPGATFVALVAFALPSSGFVLPQGELLVDVTSPLYLQLTSTPDGDLARFQVDVPLELDLAGLAASSQCVVLGAGAHLTNAIDFTIGF